MSRVRVSLIGGFGLAGVSGAPLHLPSSKGRALVCYLCLQQPEMQDRDLLATLLWTESPREQARASLRQELRRIRAMLGPEHGILISDGASVGFATGMVESDVQEFRAWSSSEGAEDLVRATELYRGDLLAGLGTDAPAFEDWLLIERESLRGLALAGLTRLAGLQEGAEAVRTLRRLVGLDPLNEAGHCALMHLLAQQGNHAAALRQYERCRDILAADLGIDPTRETVELFDAIFDGRIAAKPQGAGVAGSRVALAYPIPPPRLPDKPSIAVLPFANMGGDPEHDYFADGMTEDLITELSKISGLFVIARNSTFAYKGKTIAIRQVAEELGVRYILEGSVRRAGDQLRINAQLVDATTSGHVCAERYDGSLADVFALQDEVTQNIVTALEVNLTAAERERRARKETDAPEAYDAFLRGWGHYRLETPEDFAQSLTYFEEAIRLDPNYGRPRAALATVYWEISDNHWVKRLGMSYAKASENVRQHLEEALKDPTPFAHRTAARMHVSDGRWDEAIAEAKRAIALDANDPDACVAMSVVLVKVGRPAEGLEFVETARRLDPQSDYLWWLGDAQFHMERYDDAAATLLRATTRSPGDMWNFLLLAAAYGQLGREQEARSAIETFNKLRAEVVQRPHTLAGVDDWSFRHSAERERLREGLRKAGMPEGGAAAP